MINKRILDVVINIIMVCGIVVLAVILYGAMLEDNLKQKFDRECFNRGGIPLRSTFFYDKKDNQIRYVCLRATAVMDLDQEDLK